MRFKLYVAVAGLTLGTLVSCGGNEKADYVDQSLITPGSENKDTVPPSTIQTTNVVPNTVPVTIPGTAPAIPGTQTAPVNLMPQQNNMQVTQPTTITNTAATSTTAPGMNPPHGQPGHRCDINVGAPLDSKPAPVNVQQQPAAVNAQPNPVSISQVPNTQKTAPGMNPPHGEPGHRCDIAVGAPLNSKPAAPATTQTSVPPLSITPAKNNDSSKN
ncbi:MAG: hypothetical protein WAR78_05425 [Ferruginibacter sp.]